MVSKRPCIYAANHETYYDPPALFLYLVLIRKVKVGVVVKERILQVSAIWRFFIQLVPHAVVMENNPGSVLEEAAKLLKRGYSVIIFPEGTTLGKRDGYLSQGKTGVIRLALLGNNAPIIPVGILYLGRRRPFKFIKKIVAGDCFYAQPFNEYGELRAQTDSLMGVIAKLSQRKYLA